MKLSLFFIGLLFFFPLSIFAIAGGSRIDMGISPIRHEFTVGTGKTITRTITFFNNSDRIYNIYLSVEDCVADTKIGTPKCRPITSTGGDPMSLATWIKFDGPTRFSVPPKSERNVSFSVSPPKDALPGGHYGAIFFNNIDDSNENENSVKLIRRAGVLLLVNVPGLLVYDTRVGDIEIDIPLTSAPEITLNSSNLSDPALWKAWLKKIQKELDPRLDSPILIDTSDFFIEFSLPLANKGNIHTLPVGRIELYDEKGNMLRNIGKESIRSPEGVFLGEKIVDYLPINDEGGNVLPGSNRTFSVYWKGFAYETIEGGKSVIKFLSPGAYYSQLTQDNARYLFPWEKLKIFAAQKEITAKIYLEYRGEEGRIVPYQTEKKLSVKYNYIDKGINYGAILIILLIVFLAWIILRRRNHRIEELEEEVDELEEEVDELEKARTVAKDALIKKRTKQDKKESPQKKPETVKKRKTPSSPSSSQKKVSKKTP